MKNIIQIIIATILFIGCNNSKIPRPFDDNLKGNVKSVEQITYEAKEAFGELVKGERGDGWDEFYADYNDFGQVLYKQKKIITLSGELNEFDFDYKYDKNGLLERRFIERRVDSVITLNNVEYYEFHKNKNLWVVKTFESDSIYSKQTNLYYDDSGNLLWADTFDANDVLIGKYKQEWLKGGREMKLTDYNENGELVLSSRFEFDKNKNLLLSESYDENGSVDFTLKYQYTYDDFDNWIQRLDYRNNESKPSFITERTITYK
jgi:hypothetical protein